MGSQQGEDKIIADYFGDLSKGGMFLDIGAGDGKNLSNTYALADAGWCGVCIEACPVRAWKCVQSHLHRPEAQVAVVCAAMLPGEMAFPSLTDLHASDSDWSSVSKANVDRYAPKDLAFRRMVVGTCCWKDILHKFGWKFDLITMDIEGITPEVLLSMPSNFLPRCLIVEHDHGKIVYDHMAKMGYKQLIRLDYNTIGLL